MPPNLKFKVSFDGELRRFECPATFDSLCSAATTLFQLASMEGLVFKYQDADGDEITVGRLHV